MPITIVVVIRSIISFFVLLVLVRLMGKQQVSQLTFFDYVVGITVGSIAATISVQVNENTFATIVGMAVWSFLAILMAYLSIHNAKIRKLVDGEATILIANGKLLEKNLDKVKIPIDELISELRTQGVFKISDVEFALIEPSGKFSIQKKPDKQPVTTGDMKVATQPDGLPTNLIMDGEVLYDALKSIKLTKAWLYNQLKKQNIIDFTQVSLAQLDSSGNLYVDLQGNDKPFYIISTKN